MKYFYISLIKTTTMEKHPIKLDLNEYLAYLMLYAANADFEIEKEELHLIRQAVDREEYRMVRNAFDKANDAERLEVIMRYKDEYINTLRDQDAVIDQLKEVLQADGEDESVERGVFILLKKLLRL